MTTRASNASIVMLAVAILFGRAVAASAGDNAWTTSGPTTQWIGSLVPAPAGDPSLYAGAYGPILFRLENGQWETVADASGTTSYQYVNSIAIEPTNPKTIYVGVSSGVPPPGVSNGGIYRSRDEGRTWVFEDVHESDPVFIVAADPLNEWTVYAVAAACTCQTVFYCHLFGPHCSNRIYESSDYGDNWTVLGNPDEVGAFVAGPLALYAVAKGGMFKSTDGGSSWTTINSGLPLPSGIPASPAISSALAISSSDPNVLYVTTLRSARVAVYKTTDGGSTWRPTALTFDQVGLTTSIAVDPTNKDVVYVAATEAGAVPGGAGLFRTTDGGKSWAHFDAGLPDRNIQHVAVDRDGTTIHVSIYPSGVFDYTYSPPLRSRPRKSPPERTVPWR